MQTATLTGYVKKLQNTYTYYGQPGLSQRVLTAVFKLKQT